MNKIKIVRSSIQDLKTLDDIQSSDILEFIKGKIKKKKINNKLILYSIVTDNQRCGYIHKKKNNFFILLRLKSKLNYQNIIKQLSNANFLEKRINYVYLSKYLIQKISINNKKIRVKYL